METRLQGYRQLTDAYLLALARQRKGVLASFDRGLRSLAGDAFGTALQIIPTQ
jgi:predicted nucleic acid-binding protein